MAPTVVRGVPLELHPPPDYVSDVIRATGDFYEADILDEIARRVSGGVLVDVGAMIGNHAAYFAAFVPNDGIHAFEPLPANASLLRRNLPPFARWVHEVALSDWEGTGYIEAESGNLGHAVMGRCGVAVRVRTLDSYGLTDVSLLKVDVEGSEAAVLRGARDTIARCRPLIVIEDWPGTGYDLPGYTVVADWSERHQTYMLSHHLTPVLTGR